MASIKASSSYTSPLHMVSATFDRSSSSSVDSMLEKVKLKYCQPLNWKKVNLHWYSRCRNMEFNEVLFNLSNPKTY